MTTHAFTLSPAYMLQRKAPLRNTIAREQDEAARAILAMRNSPALADESSIGLVGGMAIGAMVGIFAGPPGAIAGAVVGMIVGTAAGFVWGDIKYAQSLRDMRLDRELGVSDGHVGEAPWWAPRARIGAFSAAAAGAGGSVDELDVDEQDAGPFNAPHPHGV